MPSRKQPLPPGQVLVLEIALREIKPRIWRRFAVADNATLADLHDTIQYVMGWANAHLHEFELRGQRYGVPDPDAFEGAEEIRDERKFRLSKVLGLKGFRLAYRYDFGDDWVHEVKVVDVQAPEPGVAYPVCIAGERACPPEDCGGPPGYEEFLKAIRDPRHPEHKEQLAWVGGRFDPEAFDFAGVNRRLRMLK